MRSAGRDLKNEFRRRIATAGLGKRLGYTIRDRSYPERSNSLDAAALVWTKAPHILGPHVRGEIIRSSKGRWLAVPTEAAGRAAGGRRMTPADWEQRTGLRLRAVFRPGRPGLLVADDARVNKRGLARRKGGRRRKDGILTGAQTVVIFILVPQVGLRKRVDLLQAAQAVIATVPSRIEANWKD
jgi:hypothetical protein